MKSNVLRGFFILYVDDLENDFRMNSRYLIRFGKYCVFSNDLCSVALARNKKKVFLLLANHKKPFHFSPGTSKP